MLLLVVSYQRIGRYPLSSQFKITLRPYSYQFNTRKVLAGRNKEHKINKMLNKLKECRDYLQSAHFDLVEATVNGDEVADVLDQIADLAQRLHTDVVNAMADIAGQDQKENDGI